MKKLFLFLFLLSGLTGLHAQKFYDKTFTARNFSSSPLTISGLDSDSFDYQVLVIMDYGSTSPAHLEMTFNSDTTTNYRFYSMRGRSSTASAEVVDAIDHCRIGILDSPTISFSITRITGLSGDERHIESSIGGASTFTSRRVTSNYWKNTADSINSLTISYVISTTSDARVIIYKTKKSAYQGEWILHDTLSWSSETTEKSFTVDGDKTKRFKIEYEGDRTFTFQLNDDNSSDYVHQSLRNAGGVDGATNETLTEVESQRITGGTAQQQGSFIIEAETGQERLITGSYSEATTSGYEQQETTVWYGDTATNITTIDCNSSGQTLTGSAKLYYPKNKFSTADILPFRTIETVDVSGDFSAGHTFNVTGSDDQALYKLEFTGQIQSSNIEVQINGDTASNYEEQDLKANNSTPSAASSTNDSMVVMDGNQGSLDESYFTLYIYPKSGDNRPVLCEWAGRGHVRMEKMVYWWLDSANPITSFKVFSNNTTSMNGTLKLSVLK